MSKHLKLADSQGHVLVEDPPIARALFSSTTWAWIWIPIRFWIAYQWFNSGLGKLTNPEWMVTGNAIRGYWERAVVVPPAPAKPPISFDWYREFLSLLLAGNHHVWFAKLIVFGELAVAIGLFTGTLVGIAAFGGGLMNWSFMMAGTTSTNPVLFPLSLSLIMAWKVAGYYGLDRYLLPMLGTPWTQHEAVVEPKPPMPRPTMAPAAR